MSSSTGEKVIQDIITKIIIYSSEKYENSAKLLKYLQLARNQRPVGVTLGHVEIQMQKKGATQALILWCNRLLKNFASDTLDKTEVDILVNSLSILGNAFAVNYDAAKEADKYKFITTLKCLFERGPFNTESQILNRVIKCLANLAMYPKLRWKIMQEGTAILIVARLEEIYKRLTDNNQITKPSLIDEIIIESDDEGIILQASRAIKILSSDQEFQQHLMRFGAFRAIGRFLKFSYNEDLYSNVLKALAVLSCHMKKISRDLLEDLTDTESSDRAILQRIIEILRTRLDVSKLMEPAIVCLTQLAMNTSLAKGLIEHEVFEAALEALKDTDDNARLEKLMKLLMVLTKDAPDGYLSNGLRLCCCSQIGVTLKILRIPELKDFHYWVLSLYKNLYEDKLKDLVSRGIIEVLYNYLCQELGEFTVENLRTKMSAADSDICPIHHDGSECPFYPQYRCSSPTYTEQEELRAKSTDELPAIMESKLFGDSSPAQSPRLDWSPSLSPAYSPAGSPSVSPAHSSGSESPPCSDEDEGVFSASPTVSSPLQEEDENENNYDAVEQEDETITEGTPLEEPPAKKARLESESDEAVENKMKDENANELRLRSNIVVTILGILVRCAHFPVLPSEITKFLPFLLHTVWNGRLSVEKTVVNPPTEHVPLGQMCFQRAFKILCRLCLDINLFPELVENQVIPLIYRIMVYGLVPEAQETEDKKKRVKSFLQDFSKPLMNSLLGMNGSENETYGWREGYFSRVCMTNERNSANAVLSIPFLFQQFNPTFRKFENQTRNWAVIFSLLTNVDELELTQFQTCILALSCIAKTKGLRWTDSTSASKRPLLYPSDSLPIVDSSGNEETVTFELDDGETLSFPKKILLDASPVFGAMFEGHFCETDRQAVKLRHTSLAALKTLASQIFQQQMNTQEGACETASSTGPPPSFKYCDHKISTMFELLTLSDQFLLENLYERTLNTLIAFYFCPYSSPKIYHEALKFTAGSCRGDKLSNLNLLTLKYLLVGEDISFTLRSGSFWKIFDNTAPEVVVKGLQQLLNYAH